MPREALEATLTAFEMECLGLPFAGIEATCVIAAENKDAFNRQIDTVEQSFNQVKLNENNSSFWTRATMVWLKTNLEDKRMQYNLLAKVGSKL